MNTSETKGHFVTRRKLLGAAPLVATQWVGAPLMAAPSEEVIRLTFDFDDGGLREFLRRTDDLIRFMKPKASWDSTGSAFEASAIILSPDGLQVAR